MITGKLLSTNDGGATWDSAPQWVRIAGVYHRVEDVAARGEWGELAAADPSTYREWREPGLAYLGYQPAEIEPNPEPEDSYNVAAIYKSGTEAEQRSAQREAFAVQIDANRTRAEASAVDLRRDPGLAGLMDEANAAAEAALKRLKATPDQDLDAFDPSLNPSEVGAVALSLSMARQEQDLLNSGVPLAQEQRATLETHVAEHQAIVEAGDDSVDVHNAPSFARRTIGIVGEDYGILVAFRVFDGGNWWLEFELRTDRILNPGDYWIAVYDETASDDRDDTDTGYLTTPQLTEINPGVYRADKAAVNLPRPDTAQIFKFTLCHQHISNPQFDKMTLPGGDEIERYRVRWAGNAVPGGPWEDTGQIVDSIPYGNGLRIQDTAGFSTGQQIKMNDLEYEINSVFNVTDLILTAHPDSSVIGHSVLKRG